MWPFDQNNQQMYQQYAQAYDNGNYYGIDNNQIWGHLFQFMHGAPMDMQQRIYQQHFEQMPYEQRVALAQQMPQGYYMDPNDTWSMAQSFHRLGQEQPNMLQRIMSHPLLTGAALGLVGLIAKHALSHHQQNAYQEQYGYRSSHNMVTSNLLSSMDTTRALSAKSICSAADSTRSNKRYGKNDANCVKRNRKNGARSTGKNVNITTTATNGSHTVERNM